MTAEKEATSDVDHHHHHQPPQPPPPPQCDGAAANYPPSPAVAYPQPAPPLIAANHPPPNYAQGYAYAEAAQAPLIQDPLPCCGCGIGWFLFIIGFFLGGIPWYGGAIIFLCSRTIDNRERPGYIACTIAAVLSTIAAVIEAIIRAIVQ